MKERGFFRPIMLATCVTAGSLATACSGEAATPPLNVYECTLQPIDNGDLRVLDAITDQIDTKNIDKRLTDEPVPTTPDGANDNEAFDLQKFKDKQAIAADYGFTVIDARTQANELNHEGTVEDALIKANEIFSTFGFAVNLQDGIGYAYDGDVQLLPAPDSEDIRDNPFISSKDFIFDLKSLIRTIGDMPVELVKAAGLKEIRFVSGFREKNFTGDFHDIAADGLADPETGIFYVMFNTSSSSADVFDHEFKHLLDNAYTSRFGCSLFDDPEFSSLNPEGAKYNQPPYPAEWIAEEMYRTDGDASKAVFDNGYATTNVAEDKATTGEPVDSEYLSLQRDSEVLDRKVALLLRRADEILPGYLEYRLAFTGTYGNPDCACIDITPVQLVTNSAKSL